MDGRNFATNGPIIPFEVLQAQQEGKLVFFCGAGISKYMGLPDYKGLVSDICSLAKLDTRKHATGDEFDLALHSIVRELNQFDPVQGEKAMRDYAYTSLSEFDKEKTPELHHAILGLSAHDGGHLLVTTNVDRLFHLACECNGKPTFSYEIGPKLSFPICAAKRPVVFLHGLLPEKKDDAGSLQSLVLTTADFGNAYLRYGWATRFLTELFRNFTVLFLGYSMRDRIVRYLIDAVGSSQNASEFKRPYALVPKETASQSYWNARGIMPIEYKVTKKVMSYSTRRC